MHMDLENIRKQFLNDFVDTEYMALNSILQYKNRTGKISFKMKGTQDNDIQHVWQCHELFISHHSR